MRTIVYILLTLIFCYSYGLSAEVYSWTDENGNRVYTDQKPAAQEQVTQKPLTTATPVNYYSAPTVKKPSQQTEQPALATLEAITAAEAPEALESETTKPLTERDCQRQYQLNCNQVINWRQYAKEKCGDDKRCDDEAYLDRKYRPRTLTEQQAIARRSAVRNNMRDKKIALFLTKEYTNYCENQAELYCKDKRSSQCKKVSESFCEDPRDLQDIFARYDNLTVAEKQDIVQKAKQLSVASGKDTLNYQKLLVDIIELLALKSTLGI